jgi:hypothetical protein
MRPRLRPLLPALALLVPVATAACDGETRQSPPRAPTAQPGYYPPPQYGPSGAYGQPGAPGPQYGPAPAQPYSTYGATPPPYGATPPPYGATPPPYGATPPPYGATPPPYGATPPPYGATPQPPPYVAPPVASTTGPDPITDVDVTWLRQRTITLMQELVAALPDDARRRVQGIPLAVDDTPGEVNAFAACTSGKAVMVVSDGLLDIAAHLAAARATDDVFGTRKVDEYVSFIATRQKPGQPVARPPRGFFSPAQETDARRVARQHDVLDETLGFVLGHELAHHHLGHLPCTGGPGPFGMGDLARGLSGAVPVFNQPNELAADTAGTDTILAAGARRTGYHLTEAGGVLMMQFFSAADQLSPEDILFGFERTHPPPTLRIPVIQQTANYFRLTGGAWAPLPRF